MGECKELLFRQKKRFCKCGVGQDVNTDGQHDWGMWLFAWEAHTQISNSDIWQEGRWGTGQQGGMGGCGVGVLINVMWGGTWHVDREHGQMMMEVLDDFIECSRTLPNVREGFLEFKIFIMVANCYIPCNPMP